MINSNMHSYFYYTLGDLDDYGQPTVSSNPVGEIKMAINTFNKNTQDNVLYSGATYLGLTKQKVKDTYLIQYGDIKLKVLYVIPDGRYKQVFLCPFN